MTETLTLWPCLLLSAQRYKLPGRWARLIVWAWARAWVYPRAFSRSRAWVQALVIRAGALAA